MDESSIDHHLSMWNPVNRKKSYKKWPFNSKSSCTITKVSTVVINMMSEGNVE